MGDMAFQAGRGVSSLMLVVVITIFQLIQLPGQAACLSALLLDAITVSNSFQDFTNDFAPSS